jgi:hypothetical protein
MEIIVHGYTETGQIDATIDGTRYSIPDEGGNRHRQIIAEWEAAGNTIPPYVAPPISAADVNAERDRRIAAGFEFGGNTYDFDIKAKTNISGAAQMAFMAIVAGAGHGNLRWHGGDADFSWITQDNQIVTMDAHSVVAFGKTAAGHESAYIHAARTLKNMTPIPENFAEDAYWP